jgi:hypothetical protein
VGEGRKASLKDAALEAGINTLIGGGLSTLKEGAKGLFGAFRPSDMTSKVVAQNYKPSKGDFKVEKFNEFVDVVKKYNLFDGSETNFNNADKLITEKYSTLKQALKDVGVERIAEKTPAEIKKMKGVIDVTGALDHARTTLVPKNIPSASEGIDAVANKVDTKFNDKMFKIAESLKKEGYNIDIVDERKYQLLNYMLGDKKTVGGKFKIYADPEATQKLMQDFKAKEITNWLQPDAESTTSSIYAKSLYFNLRDKIDEAAPNAKIKEIGKELQYLMLAKDLSEKGVLAEAKLAQLSLNDLISVSALISASGPLNKLASLFVGGAQRVQKNPSLGKLTSKLEKTEPFFDNLEATRPSSQRALRALGRTYVPGNENQIESESLIKKPQESDEEKKRKDILNKLNSIRMR